MHINFVPKIVLLMSTVEKKYCGAMPATGDNTAHAPRVLGTKSTTHTHNMLYYLVSHGTCGYAKAPQC
jgi:hypothetical protein